MSKAGPDDDLHNREELMTNDNFGVEQQDYLVSYYDKDGLLHHVAEFGNEEHAKYCTKSQQKHFEGVDLFVVKRTFTLEVV
jgi:hypothetical protein